MQASKPNRQFKARSELLRACVSFKAHLASCFKKLPPVAVGLVPCYKRECRSHHGYAPRGERCSMSCHASSCLCFSCNYYLVK